MQIRPASADGLCLTDGQVGDYESLVAVQRPCDEVAPQETTLVRLTAKTYRIQWSHPDHGKGCLKALAGGPTDGLLEPWDMCEQTSRFRFEPLGPAESGRFTLRVDEGECVTMKGSPTSAGAAAGTEPCRGRADQVFVVAPLR